MYNNESKIRMEYVSAKSFTNYGGNYKKALRVSRRLLELAQVLNVSENIGLKIIMGEEIKNYIFSSPGSNVTLDDFNWIFNDFAKVIPEKYIIWDESKSSDEKEYELLYSPCKIEGKEGDFDEESDDSFFDRHMWNDDISNKYFEELCNEMEQEKVHINIILRGGNEEKNPGRIIFSFPKEIPMRIRALVSMVFPNTILSERGKASGGINLSGFSIKNYIVRFLKILEREQKNPEDETDNESIKGLRLSLRLYNCLKKAGITTIKQFCKIKIDNFYNKRSLGVKNFREIEEKLEELRERLPEYFNEEPAEKINIREKLEDLVGIQSAKKQIKQITAFAKMKKDMEAKGENIPITLNMEFVGNPGTAKTTVARIMARTFADIGITKSEELVEAGRADLLAGYVGQTAGKVRSVFEMAKGKVLLIDEAYSLVESEKDSFGDEAINTIVQEMENNREDTIVIFAGYPDEMEKFFSRNPGLRSRVPFTIKFEDYSMEELIKICELEAKKRNFTIADDAKEKIGELCEKAMGNPEMGNGRFCRNIIEKAILAFAERVYGGEKVGEDVSYTLTGDDFVMTDIVSKKGKTYIGFKAI